MTQWMNLTRIGKYGRQIVKKRSRKCETRNYMNQSENT